MHKAQRLINHVALVLDGSGSMSHHKKNLIKVADEQIKYLAQRSEELSQETRVSVYVFDNVVNCVIFDMDVMRLPSIADLYSVRGMTALIDATLKSQEDLETTSQIYGDHAFLTFVLTDGLENASRNLSGSLARKIATAPVNWSLGFLVPDSQGKAYVSRLGVENGSIAIWDTTSATGINDAVSSIRTATDSFMTNRASGVRGTRSVFSTGVDAVNRKTVLGALTPLPKSKYRIEAVPGDERIDDFVRSLGIPYVKGIAYYQLTKTETIQPQKELVVVDKKTDKAYTGSDARGLVGLPANQNARVRPEANPLYDIFVQSTSLNRKLIKGTRLFIKA